MSELSREKLIEWLKEWYQPESIIRRLKHEKQAYEQILSLLSQKEVSEEKEGENE